jgi:hypothetical protein
MHLIHIIVSTYGDLDIVIFEDEGGVNDSKFSRHAIVKLKENFSFQCRNAPCQEIR